MTHSTWWTICGTMWVYVPALTMDSFLNITSAQKWNSLNKVPCERLARLRKWPLYVWSSAVICLTIFLSKVRAQRGKCLNISFNVLHNFSVAGPKRFCRSNPDTYFVWLLSSACSLSFFRNHWFFTVDHNRNCVKSQCLFRFLLLNRYFIQYRTQMFVY